jgi:hypothetical protein
MLTNMLVLCGGRDKAALVFLVALIPILHFLFPQCPMCLLFMALWSTINAYKTPSPRKLPGHPRPIHISHVATLLQREERRRPIPPPRRLALLPPPLQPWWPRHMQQNRPDYKNASTKTITAVIKFLYLSSRNPGVQKSWRISNNDRHTNQDRSDSTQHIIHYNISQVACGLHPSEFKRKYYKPSLFRGSNIVQYLTS